MAKGKMKFAGKLAASTCTIGCMNWATLGLNPIQTPIGTQIERGGDYDDDRPAGR